MEKGKLIDYMTKKNAEAKGESILIIDEKEESSVTEREKPISKEISQENTRAINALTTLRMILNAICIIPIILTTIGLLGYILLKFLPSTIAFIKRLIYLILISK